MSGKLTITLDYDEQGFKDGDFTQEHLMLKHIQNLIPGIVFAQDIKGCERAHLGTLHMSNVRTHFERDPINMGDHKEFLDAGNGSAHYRRINNVKERAPPRMQPVNI